jgi:ATP-dependent Lon protease
VPGAKKKSGQPSSFTPKEILDYLESLPDADQVADLVSCALLPGAVERQTILETAPIEQRLKHLVHFLLDEIRRCRKDAHS